MVNDSYNPTLAAYLNDIIQVPFVVGPKGSNGNQKLFEEERDRRNIKFGFIIQKYLSCERRLLTEIRDLEKKTKPEAELKVPRGYTQEELTEEYQEKLKSARMRLDYYKGKYGPEYVQAEHGLSQSCLLLVVNIARGYARKYQVNINDLIEDGNTGLMRAVKKFDPTLGFKFSTYATYWIRQSIMRGLYGEMRKDLALAYKLCQRKSKITRIEDMLISEFEREPTEEEVIERYNQVYGTKGPSHRIEGDDVRALRQSRKVSRLVTSTCEEEQNLDIEEKRTQLSYEISDGNEKIHKVLDYLNNSDDLNLDEREVVKDRYGLEGRTPKTLKELGEILGLTRERIRQIESAAMRKLKLHFDPRYRTEVIKRENEK